MSLAIEDAPEKFRRFMFRIREIFIENIERYTVKCSNFVNLQARNTFFFLTGQNFGQLFFEEISDTFANKADSLFTKRRKMEEGKLSFFN